MKNLWLRLLCVFMVFMLLSGCKITLDPQETANPDPDPANPINPINPIEQLYEKNLLKWQNQKLQSYDYVFQRICFCPRESTRPARVSVQSSQIESIRWIETYQEVEQDKRNIFLSVDQVFALIEDAIDKNAATIRVDYDASFGYPTNVYIDYDERIADEELSIRASVLQAAPDGVIPLPTTCEPYSTDSYEYLIGAESDINFATLQFFPEDSGLLKACFRGQHKDGCVEAVELSSSYQNGEFKLTRSIVPIQTFVACTQVVTPFAKVVEFDVSGLEPKIYPVKYFPTIDTPNPQITTSFELKPSVFASCLPSGINDQTIVSAIMKSNSSGQNVIEKVSVIEKLQDINASCTDTGQSNVLKDDTGKEIRFYKLVGCWGARPDDADEQITKQDAELKALEESFTVITLTCNPGGLPYP